MRSARCPLSFLIAREVADGPKGYRLRSRQSVVNGRQELIVARKASKSTAAPLVVAAAGRIGRDCTDAAMSIFLGDDPWIELLDQSRALRLGCGQL